VGILIQSGRSLWKEVNTAQPLTQEELNLLVGKMLLEVKEADVGSSASDMDEK